MTETTKEAIQRHQEACNVTRGKMKEAEFWDGPWMTEPDRVEFKAYGLDCLLSRNPWLLNWCGYVGVSLDHPNVKRLVKKTLKLSSYEREYLEDEEDNLDVHGGITYREECQGPICHITEEKDKLFWLGFDCAHAGDLVPGMDLAMKIAPKPDADMHTIQEQLDKLDSMIKKEGDSSAFFGPAYRDINYVMEQTKYLARQLAEYKTRNSMG